MKKVTIKNFIQVFIFLTAAQATALVDMALHFPQRYKSRFLFRSFSASFLCIVEELTSSSSPFNSKSYGFSLSKPERLSSESEELKEISLDEKLNHSLYIV